MNFTHFWSRLQGRYQRTLSGLFFRRPIELHSSVPCISFTFDDFPRSALHAGGKILQQFGLRGTYYASLGLMGTEAPTGEIFVAEDIKKLLAEGHELGCHTFGHCHSWKTTSKIFEDSIIKNRQALDELVSGAVFRSFSYPIIGPRPLSKRKAGRHFSCCRGGGQTFNSGMADLNHLKAFFLEKSRDNPDIVKKIIDQNSEARGWLIFATHDISETHTQYGCTPSFFEDIVKYALASGTTILPVTEALDAIALHSGIKASSER